MKRFGLAVCAGVLLIAGSHRAAAEWLHKKGTDDPFKGGSEQIAMSIEFGTGQMIGVKCTTIDDVTLIFVPYEKPDASTAQLLPLLKARLLVIIDDQPKVELSATLVITPDGERLRIDADGPEVVKLVPSIASAKRRVALAGEINGKVAWSQAFGMSGSRRALQPLMASCKIPG